MGPTKAPSLSSLTWYELTAPTAARHLCLTDYQMDVIARSCGGGGVALVLPPGIAALSALVARNAVKKSDKPAKREPSDNCVVYSRPFHSLCVHGGWVARIHHAHRTHAPRPAVQPRLAGPVVCQYLPITHHAPIEDESLLKESLGIGVQAILSGYWSMALSLSFVDVRVTWVHFFSLTAPW